MARSGLFFILSTLCLAISPGWQADPKVATSGQILELECEEKYPIHWCYPRLYDDPCMIKESPGNIELSYEKENKYKGRLIIQSASYSDTGYYYCISNETTQCSLQMDNAQRQYVYVQDNNHPLAVETPCEIEAELQGNAILPCRPTRPNFEMILSKDWIDLTLGRQEDSDMTIEFVHTIGFILRNVTIFATGTYHCKDASDMELAEINLRVIKQKTNYAMRPRIIAPLHPIVRKGKKLVLKCEALAQERVNFDVTWEMPHKSRPHTTEESCKRDNYKCRINSLTIHSVTYNDGGTYTCTIKTQYNSKNHTVKAIKVIGENEVGITLGSDSNGSIFVHVRNNNELKIVVTVTAPENVSLLWYGPKGSPLQSDERKYHIEYKDDRSILKVLDLNLHDAGMYILEASNSYGKMSLNRTVIVQDKPKVSLGQNQVLFPVDSRVNFSCEVWSPKPVDIKWFFKTCDLRKPRDCEGGIDFRLQNSSEVMHDSKKPYDVSNFSLISTQGILRCVANNSFGSGNDSLSVYITDNRHVTETPHVWGEPEDVVLEEDDVFKVVEGDTFTLNCASSVYNNTKHSAWYRNGSTVHNSSALIITYEETKFLYLSNLKFINVTKEQHDVEYLCYENDGARTPQGKHLSVEDPEEAKIIETNLNETIEVKLGLLGLSMSCKSKGKPVPKTLWYRKDGKLVVNDTGLELTDRNQSLKIAVMTPDYEGNYRCVVKNRLKEDLRAGKVTITDKGGVSVIMAVIIAVCVVGVIVLVIVLIVKMRKEKKLQEELNLAGLANFEKGALESINPELPVDEQADLLPYDRSWEFPGEKLFLGKQLGAGAFGVVMKAEAHGIVDHEEKTTVAVKMVKSGADRSFIKALASELKIMTHLGKHLNVVNLLGASTKNLAKMQLMVIVEFCRYGNLHNYLLRHRDDFVDQLDHTTGELNLALGMDKLSRSQSAKSKTNLKLRLLSYTSRMAGGSYSGVPSSDPDVPSTPDTTEMSVIGSDMTVVSSPTGEPDECLLSNSSSEQPEWRVKYCSDYKGTTMPVCSQDLFCWAFQVARGMEYLASRKVLHGDLAARNILLADDNIVKICDFGLAKSMYKSDNYRKKSASPLPVKWMALESIRDRVFSTQSDVWSFGIVLWELFSLAQAPYPGMEADENLYLKLVNGYRMEQPPYATNAIYRTMLQSWDASPGKRPSFSELVEQLGAMLDDNLRRHYEELNGPYVDMNERNSHSDYLNMMSAPNYNNIIAPLEVQHEYVNSPRLHSGEDKPTHLDMSSTTVVSPLSTDSVFEFSDEANTSGYLSMMGKEGIFSPGHAKDKPFRFSPQAQKEEATEKKHLNQANLSSLDNYVNMAQKSITQTNFENPSYLMTKPS